MLVALSNAVAVPSTRLKNASQAVFAYCVQLHNNTGTAAARLYFFLLWIRLPDSSEHDSALLLVAVTDSFNRRHDQTGTLMTANSVLVKICPRRFIVKGRTGDMTRKQARSSLNTGTRVTGQPRQVINDGR